MKNKFEINKNLIIICSAVLLIAIMLCTDYRSLRSVRIRSHTTLDLMEQLDLETLLNTYIGENKKANEVEQLILDVILSNQERKTMVTIKFNGGKYFWEEEKLNEFIENLDSRETYTIKIDKKDSNGRFGYVYKYKISIHTEKV